MIEAAAIAAHGTEGWGNLSGPEQQEWRERIKAAAPYLLSDEEAPTEVLRLPGEHRIPGHDENDPLSRIAIALEIGTSILGEAMTLLQAMAARDPQIAEHLRRVERERQKPPPPR